MSRTRQFYGYRRPDGGVGVRNHVMVIAAMDNANPVARRIAEGIAQTGKPVEWFSIQEVGGTVKAAERGIRIASGMVMEAARAKREPVPLSELVLGVECGGSDTTSGLASNPATGQVADWVVEAGGTVVLSRGGKGATGGRRAVRGAGTPARLPAH